MVTPLLRLSPSRRHLHRDIDDVKYLEVNYSALKVPQSYLSREGADEDKSTLAQKDIRFARTIQRLQRAVLSEIEKIGVVHLYTLGWFGRFQPILEQPIHRRTAKDNIGEPLDVASGAAEGYFSKRWIATNLFGLTDD